MESTRATQTSYRTTHVVFPPWARGPVSRSSLRHPRIPHQTNLAATGQSTTSTTATPCDWRRRCNKLTSTKPPPREKPRTLGAARSEVSAAETLGCWIRSVVNSLSRTDDQGRTMFLRGFGRSSTVGHMSHHNYRKWSQTLIQAIPCKPKLGTGCPVGVCAFFVFFSIFASSMFL